MVHCSNKQNIGIQCIIDLNLFFKNGRVSGECTGDSDHNGNGDATLMNQLQFAFLYSKFHLAESGNGTDIKIKFLVD